MVGNLKILPEDCQDYQFWSSDHYTRNCIVRDSDYELILLCWEPGQETPIHCHGGEECWVYMIQGNLVEKRFANGEKEPGQLLGEMDLGKFQKSYINDAMGFHSLHNQTDMRSMSLHLYHEPIKDCRVYNEDLGIFERRTLEDYSYEGRKLSLKDATD